MTHASTSLEQAPASGGGAPASPAAASAQLRPALRGMDYVQQKSLLTPVQRRAPGSVSPREADGAGAAPEAERGAPPSARVQRRIHRSPPSDAPVQLSRSEGAGELVQLKPAVQMRGGKAEAFYGDFTLAGTGVTDKHMFEGEVKAGDPKGLHSYAGGMPGVTVLASVGNENSVHIILWTKGGSTKCKWSSMFPKEMSRGMVCWYVKRFSEGKSTDGAPNDHEGRPGTGWTGITLSGAGDTVYPVCGASYSQAEGYSNDQRGPGITKNNVFYKIANP